MSRHRERHRERRRSERKTTGRERWRARYPDPGLAETTDIGEVATAFGISWLARRWRDRKARKSM